MNMQGWFPLGLTGDCVKSTCWYWKASLQETGTHTGIICWWRPLWETCCTMRRLMLAGTVLESSHSSVSVGAYLPASRPVQVLGPIGQGAHFIGTWPHPPVGWQQPQPAVASQLRTHPHLAPGCPAVSHPGTGPCPSAGQQPPYETGSGSQLDQGLTYFLP